MTRRFIKIMLATMGLGISALVQATPISGSSLQTAITAMGGVVNVQTDQYALDETFRVGGARFAISIVQFENSDFAGLNSFGIYDVFNIANRLTLFSGPDGAGATGFIHNPVGNSYCVFTFATLGSPACAIFGSTQFGFFLNTPQGTFYSQRVLNADGIDHLVAFEGGPTRGTLGGNPWLANEYLLAWEDLYGGGDRDYDDFVVLIESIIGVPEPTAIALFGMGLLAIGIIARRRLRGAVVYHR